MTTAILPPGPVDALLGVETGGIAPAFSPLGPTGGLSKATRAWLAVSGLTAEGRAQFTACAHAGHGAEGV